MCTSFALRRIVKFSQYKLIRNIQAYAVFAYFFLFAASMSAQDYSKRQLNDLLMLSKQGDREAKIEIGDRCLAGRDKIISQKTAFHWYCEAAENGDWEDLLQYIKNDFSERDHLLYFAIAQAASTTNAIAYGHMMAGIYLGARDFQGAFSWFNFAKNLGSLEATNNQGCLALLKNDRRQAVELFRSAAIGGLPGAMYNLGLEAYKYYLERNSKVRSDLFFAKYWLEQASKRGQQEAMNLLKHINVEALILEEINNTSIKDPDPKVLLNTARLLLEQGRKKERDAARQIRYYLLICHKLDREPDADIIFTYGLLCHKGLSTAEENAKAYKYIEQAAKRQHYEARREMGRYLLSNAQNKNEVEGAVSALCSLSNDDRIIDEILAEAYSKKAFKLTNALATRTANGLLKLCDQNNQRACLELFRWHLHRKDVDASVDEAQKISKIMRGKERQIAIYELAKHYSETNAYQHAIAQWELLESLSGPGSNMLKESRQRLAEYYISGMYYDPKLEHVAQLLQAHDAKQFFLKALNTVSFIDINNDVANRLIEDCTNVFSDKKSKNSIARKLLQTSIDLGDAHARVLMLKCLHETDQKEAIKYLNEIIPPEEAARALALFMNDELQPNSFPPDWAPLANMAIDWVPKARGYLCLAAGAGDYSMAKLLGKLVWGGEWGFKKNLPLASSWILRALTNEDGESLYMRALVHHQKSDIVSAVDLYKKAMLLKHDDAKDHLYYTSFHYQENKMHEKAAEILRAVIDFDPQADDEIGRKAKLHLGLMMVNNIGIKNFNIETGINLLEESRHVTGWITLINYYIETKQYEKALSKCDMVLRQPRLSKEEKLQANIMKAYALLANDPMSENNLRIAAELFFQARIQSPVASYNFGIMQCLGAGVERQIHTAMVEIIVPLSGDPNIIDYAFALKPLQLEAAKAQPDFVKAVKQFIRIKMLIVQGELIRKKNSRNNQVDPNLMNIIFNAIKRELIGYREDARFSGCLVSINNALEIIEKALTR